MDRFKRMGLAALVVLPLFGGCQSEVRGPVGPDQEQDGDDDPTISINVSDFGSGDIA